MSPDSDMAPPQAKPASQAVGGKRKQRLFYMSSEENSEAAPESPESNTSLPVATGHDMELDEFERRRMLGAVNSHGPQVADVALPGIQTGSSFSKETCVNSESVEESPNPLYRLNEMDV